MSIEVAQMNIADRLTVAIKRIERLKSALEPFGRNASAKSLVDALGHITREDMERAKELSKPD